MDFYTNCYIPSLKKEIKVNKITFGDYFELNSYIQNSDYININRIFNKICERSLKDLNEISNLDKFSILLHLKTVFLGPMLSLSAKDRDENNITYDIILNDIFENIKKYEKKDFILPKNLYYADSEDILKETGNNIENIKKHIEDNKHLLFKVPSFIRGIPTVYINCFDNTLFYFCKLLYSSDLLNFYKKIKILKKDFNFLLSEIYDMSPKELDIFLNTK
jgi:hypothetical protein